MIKRSRMYSFLIDIFLLTSWFVMVGFIIIVGGQL